MLFRLLNGFLILAAALAVLPAARADEPFKEFIRKTPPRSPEEERAGFHLPPDFQITLVASEPAIGKPVNLAFDAKGRLWLTTTREYPFPKKDGSDGEDSVKVIELASDGHAAKITTFADKLDIPIGLYPQLPSPTIYDINSIKRYFDDDQDGHADRNQVLYTGFGYEQDTHGMTNAFRRGFDGWLYADHGTGNTSTVAGSDGKTIVMAQGHTYRMRLDGSHVEIFTNGQTNPFGLTWDALGNLYSSDSHSKPFYQLLRGGFYESLDYIDDGMGFAPQMMKQNWHGSTALAGACCYVAEAFPKAFQNNLFCGNVMTSRINRDSVTHNGSSPEAHQEEDFLVSDDPWFRPVDIQLGPDGALYVADFYNRIIGHYEVPLSEPRRDHIRARIWRISYRPSDTGVHEFDLTKQSVDGLLALLSDVNLRVRMPATDEITDRIGKAAIPAITALLKSGKASVYQRIHCMWALHRLDSLDDAMLTDFSHESDSAVRVHAMRVLADIAKWNVAEETLALAGLHDADPLVRRCAADALGAHPDRAHVRPLLTLLESTDVLDTHLIYVSRVAIRDCLKTDGALANIGNLSSAELQIVADLTMSIPTPAAADFLLAHLDDLKGSRQRISAYTHHAVRYVAKEHVDALLKAFRKRFAGNVVEQMDVLSSIASGATERGEPVAPECRQWALELATAAMGEPVTIDGNGWTYAPLDAKKPGRNPWTIQDIYSADNEDPSPFLSSLPFGEQLTGTLRSPTFAIPAQLKFYIAGQNGRPGSKLPNKNFVRLKLASDNSVIAETPTPRKDAAQPVVWDLRWHVGEKGYLELVDANNGPDYAWLAAGRFEPDVAPIPNVGAAATETQRAAACRLAGALKLGELRPAVLQHLNNRNFAKETRVAAAGALVAIDADAATDDLVRVIAEASESTDLRGELTDVLPGIRTKAQADGLISCFSNGTGKLQRAVGVSLCKTMFGAEALFAAAAQDKAPRSLLQSIDIHMQLATVKFPNLDERIAQLTKGLPTVTEEINHIVRARLNAFQRASGNADHGAKIFAANCIVCHSINGAGARVGPQLDGIGSRGPERLIEDILDPSRNVDPLFRYSNVYLKDGRVLSVLKRRDEGDTTIYVDSTGKEIVVPKGNIVKSVPSVLSLMPSGFGEAIHDQDFNDLLTFLLSVPKKQ